MPQLDESETMEYATEIKSHGFRPWLIECRVQES